MNKKIILIFSIIMIFTLAGCASAPAAQATPPSDQASQSNPPAGQGNRPTPDPATLLEQRLAPGTLKLEGTNLAVSADEAKTLLPLWQKVQALSADNTTAPTDIQTAYQQVESAMTSDQIQAIQQMSLTQTDLQDLAQSLGVQMPAFGGQNPASGGTTATLTADERATRVASRQETQSVLGTPTGNGNPSANGTPGGFRGGRGGMGQIFIDPLIKLLQQKSGG